MKLAAHRNKHQKGFTLIELSLFIAISGAILVGIMISTRTVIGNQEDNDSVQNFANFLRNLYALTINPQYGDGKQGDGTSSDTAVYGCVAVFGAKNNSTVQTYLITGPANFTNDLESYTKIDSDDMDGFQLTEYNTYHTAWDAQIKNAKSVNNDYKGSIIIMHNPTGSGINTYKANSTTVNDIMADREPLTEDEVFCVQSSGSSFVRGVKISTYGQNASAVSILDKGEICHE